MSDAPQKLPRPTGVCGFEDGTCDWTNDNNNWEHKWTLSHSVDPALCLSKVDVKKKSKSSWLAYDVEAEVKKQAGVFEDAKARLWSPKVHL